MIRSKMSMKNVAKKAVPALTVIQLAAAAMFAMPALSHAHGYVESPPDRFYQCKLEANSGGAKSDGCQKLTAISPNKIYEPQSNARGGALDDHEEAIADGQLCAGGKADWAGGDQIAEWKASDITPDADGSYTLKYKQTAEHVTKYFKTYITKDSYDFKSPIKWSDLQQIGETGPRDREPYSDLAIKIPSGMTGKHVLYTIWQRAPEDNKEAFYSCTDVNIIAESAAWKPSGPLVAEGTMQAGTTIRLRVFNLKGRDNDVAQYDLKLDKTMQPQEWIVALANKVNQESQIVRIGKLEDGKVVPVNDATGNKLYGNGKPYQATFEFHSGDDQPAILPPQAKLNGPSEVAANAKVTLSAAESAGGELKFSWTTPTGIEAQENGDSLTFTAPKADQDKDYAFTVLVENSKGSADATHTVTVKADKGGDDDGQQADAYKPGTTYKAGALVSNGGKIYRCKDFPASGWCSPPSADCTSRR